MARQADPDHLGPLATWVAPFAGCFTRPTWANLLILVAGAILAPGRRTVAAVLSSVGLRGAATFTNPHRVLNRSRWSGRAAARCLLGLLVAAFVPSGPVVVGIDEIIERHWRAMIKAPRAAPPPAPSETDRKGDGIYRDPVRSSRGHFVKASGLRWISVMLLAPVPFAGRVWALPFLTALAPSERHAQAQGGRHKLLLLARWLPDRQVIAVADSSHAAIELLAAVRRHVTVITANSGEIARAAARRPPVRPAVSACAPPGEMSAKLTGRLPGTKGRPRLSGARQPTPLQRLADPTTAWQRITVTGWYGHGERRLDVVSGAAL